MQANKKLLMIAYHYPPVAESSGYIRTLKFAKYLKKMGWQPHILTVKPSTYNSVHPPGTFEEVDVPVIRCLALNAKKHLSLYGRTLSCLTSPDPFSSWIPHAIYKGLQFIKREKPCAIWSTYPVVSAHLIGLSLKKKTGLPWIVDMRDPIFEEEFVSESLGNIGFCEKIRMRCDQKIIQHADSCVFVTKSMQTLYAKRYPEYDVDEKSVVLSNGYDEDDFVDPLPAKAFPKDKKTLLYCGTLSDENRSLEFFFEALAELRSEYTGRDSRQKLQFEFYSGAPEERYVAIIEKLNLNDCVRFYDFVSYQQSIANMLKADGLILLQSDNCFRQIPAKAYEYMRTSRPIVCLTDKNGETGQLLRKDYRANSFIGLIDDKASIKQALLAFIESDTNGVDLDRRSIAKYSRGDLSKGLIRVIEGVCSGHENKEKN